MTPSVETRRAPDDQTRRDARLPVGRVAMTPRSYDAEAHTVELVAATGYPVRRYDWEAGTGYFEVLAISDDAINGERVDQGVAPFLDTHSSWAIDDQLGRILSWRVEGGQLITLIKFGGSERALSAEAEVAAGNLRGVSVGYRRDQMAKESRQDDRLPTYTVTRWTLLEVSLVPIPADPASGVRSEDGFHPCSIIENRMGAADPGDPASPEEEDNTMRNRLLGGVAALAMAAETGSGSGAEADTQERTEATPAPAAEQRRADPAANPVRLQGTELIDFMEDARGLGDDIVTQARGWATNLSPEQARNHLLRAFADAQRRDAPRDPRQSQVRVDRDEGDTRRGALENALQHRIDPTQELTEPARAYRAMTLMEMGRASLDAAGVPTRGLGRRELASAILGHHADGSRMHSTSDFPNVLSNVTRATLRGGYTQAPQTFKRWQRRASAPDFRQISRLQFGSAPSFLLVPEGGEFKMGTIGDSKEVYALATYGRKFSITRQTIINDDLDAFSRIPALFGAAAARFESDAAYAPLIANPNMADGNALFSSAHGNLAGAGAALAEGSLQAAEIAFGAQTGLGGEVLNLTPRFLITARKDSVPARKLLTAVQSTATADVNVYADAFELIVESRLNRTSGATPWFMAADPAQVDTIEYAYLDGDDGVFLDERQGFDVDGIEYKARLDFGVKAIDWRGLYQNPGT